MDGIQIGMTRTSMDLMGTLIPVRNILNRKPSLRLLIKMFLVGTLFPSRRVVDVDAAAVTVVVAEEAW